MRLITEGVHTMAFAIVHTSREMRVNWFRLLWDLKALGHSRADIAGRTGLSEDKLDRYTRGAEPRYCDGETLIGFWSRITGRHRDQVPKISPYSYRA